MKNGTLWLDTDGRGIQAHGGSIRGDTIHNAQGQPAGARFTLLLPRGTPPTDLGTDADTTSEV